MYGSCGKKRLNRISSGIQYKNIRLNLPAKNSRKLILAGNGDIYQEELLSNVFDENKSQIEQA